MSIRNRLHVAGLISEWIFFARVVVVVPVSSAVKLSNDRICDFFCDARHGLDDLVRWLALPGPLVCAFLVHVEEQFVSLWRAGAQYEVFVKHRFDAVGQCLDAPGFCAATAAKRAFGFAAGLLDLGDEHLIGHASMAHEVNLIG